MVSTVTTGSYHFAQLERPYEPGPDGRPPLAVGLFVRAEIEGPEFAGVVAVPREAVRPDGSVLVVDEHDRLERREIEVLRIDRGQALIRGDLRERERICVSTVRAFLPGMRVSVMEAESDAPQEAARS